MRVNEADKDDGDRRVEEADAVRVKAGKDEADRRVEEADKEAQMSDNAVDDDADKRVEAVERVDDMLNLKLVKRSESAGQAVHRSLALHFDLIELHPHFSSTLAFHKTS